MDASCNARMLCCWVEVNLWAVTHPSIALAGAMEVAGQDSEAHAPQQRFEHALAINVTNLLGDEASTGDGDGRDVKLVSVLGNILAIATELAVFVISMNFDVKGETMTRTFLLKWLAQF